MSRSGLLPRSRVASSRIWGVLAAALVLSFGLELCLGSVLIAPQQVLRILIGNSDAPEPWQQIILLFRLPRALTAALAGACLGMAGLQMQALFRNPLADPSVLGVNSGASLGVALVVLAAGASGTNRFIGDWVGAGMVQIVAASLGATAVMVLIAAVARAVENSVTLLIVGLMLGYLSGSVVTVLMSLAVDQQLQRYVSWSFGSFAGVTWNQLQVFAPVALCVLVYGLLNAKAMNALLLGDNYARSLGFDVRKARMLLAVAASVLAACVTVYCGPIGFVGIAVPQLARSCMRTTDHHVLAPVVVVVGATLAMLADLLAHAPGTALALPLNAITAAIGAPIVLSIVLRRRQILEAAA